MANLLTTFQLRAQRFLAAYALDQTGDQSYPYSPAQVAHLTRFLGVLADPYLSWTLEEKEAAACYYTRVFDLACAPLSLLPAYRVTLEDCCGMEGGDGGVVPQDPTPGPYTPQGPSFRDFLDTVEGGSVVIDPVAGIPLSQYRYKLGPSGSPLPVPLDGVIVVPASFAGNVYAYSLAQGRRNQSPVVSSQGFSSASQVPSVVFTSPTNGGRLTQGTTALLQVTATDPQGFNITTVRFYNGGILLGTGTVLGVTANGGTRWQYPFVVPSSGSGADLTAIAINENDVDATGACFVYLDAPLSSNQRPVANAGSNQAITLPTSQVTLSGGLSADPDGAVASYAWTQVSGPNPATGLPSTLSGPTVSGLVAGTYVFRLVVTDTQGLASSPATVQVVVNPAQALPSYNTTLSLSTGIADGMSFTPPSTELLKFNLINGTSGASIDIAITSLGATSYLTLAGEYAGQGYAFFNSAGTRFDGTFPSSDNLTITY